MFKKRFIILLLLAFTACGFQPLYSDNNPTSSLSNVSLGNVSLDKYPSKIDYNFQSELKSFFTTIDNPRPKKYVIDISLSKAVENYGTQQNSINTRSILMLSANYIITDITTGEVVGSDTQKIMDSYEVSVSPYASIVSEDETANKLAKNLAREIILRLENEIMSYESR